MNTKQSPVIAYCQEPRTISDLLAEGFTSNQVYACVKSGALLNLTRRDAWGRITPNKPGLFLAANSSHSPDYLPHYVAARAPQIDATTLIDVWGRTRPP